MNIKLLKSDILSNNIPNFLIFVEQEPALANQYVSSISDTVGKSISYYYTFDSLIYEIQTNIKKDYLYVVRDENALKKSGEKYLTALVDIAKSGKSIVVLTTITDRASPVHSRFSQYVVDFPKLDKYTILAYCIKLCKDRNVTITQEKIEELIDKCDCSLGAVLSEMDKVFTLEQANSDVLFDYMMNSGFSDYREFREDEFITKVIKKDPSAFEDLLKVNTSPVSLAYQMYRKARAYLISSKNPYYGKVMRECEFAYSGIIDGTLNSNYALKNMLVNLYN